LCFDSAASRAEHDKVERLDHTRTVAAALVQLEASSFDRACLSGKVDTLVDGYLVSFNVSAKQTAAMRKILADEFLSLAPFTELSYRIWRRIMREDTDLPEPVLRVASDMLLPDVDFPLPVVFIPQRTAATTRPSEVVGRRPLRAFFSRGKA
jgi:hypothetical protein